MRKGSIAFEESLLNPLVLQLDRLFILLVARIQIEVQTKPEAVLEDQEIGKGQDAGQDEYGIGTDQERMLPGKPAERVEKDGNDRDQTELEPETQQAHIGVEDALLLQLGDDGMHVTGDESVPPPA